MKRIIKTVLVGLLAVTACCGCGKSTVLTMSEAYQVEKDDSRDIYSNTNLSYADSFAENIAVVGADATNSSDSDKLNSEAGLLIDATTGEVLFQKNAHTKEYPASTTKILTSLLCLKYGDTTASRKVGDEVIINESNVVICDFRQGDLVPFDVAFHGMLMKSGNDAAAVMALFVSDTLQDFADLMNKEAKELGATESNFVNPHGLFNENHYTTAYDMYLIFNEAIKYDKFIEAISCKAYTNTISRSTAYGDYQINCTYTNTNQYVVGGRSVPDGITVIGGKAGYTEKARRSYVMLAEANGHKYIFVIMKCESVDEMYADLDMLLTKIPVTTSKTEYADNN